jgi:hypothetical protein
MLPGRGRPPKTEELKELGVKWRRYRLMKAMRETGWRRRRPSYAGEEVKPPGNLSIARTLLAVAGYNPKVRENLLSGLTDELPSLSTLRGDIADLIRFIETTQLDPRPPRLGKRSRRRAIDFIAGWSKR